MPLNSLELQQSRDRLDELRRKLKRTSIEDLVETRGLFLELTDVLEHVIHVVERLNRESER